MTGNYNLLVINYAIKGLDGDMVFANEVNALLMKCSGRAEGGLSISPILDSQCTTQSTCWPADVSIKLSSSQR